MGKGVLVTDQIEEVVEFVRAMLDTHHNMVVEVRPAQPHERVP